MHTPATLISTPEFEQNDEIISKINEIFRFVQNCPALFRFAPVQNCPDLPYGCAYYKMINKLDNIFYWFIKRFDIKNRNIPNKDVHLSHSIETYCGKLIRHNGLRSSYSTILYTVRATKSVSVILLCEHVRKQHDVLIQVKQRT